MKKSNSEVGHAKNIANLNLLNTHILALGATYNPANPKLKLVNLQETYTAAHDFQEGVNDELAPYSKAVDAREAVFKPLNRELSKLRKAYKATQGVTQAQLENFMTVVRKLKGDKKSSKSNPEDPESISVSQMSYDQRTNNMDALIALLENTDNYNPNETEYKVATYENKKAQMLQTTQVVATTGVALTKARAKRNQALYLSDDNLVDLATKAKDYLFTILDSDSADYKAIAKIRFKRN